MNYFNIPTNRAIVLDALGIERATWIAELVNNSDEELRRIAKERGYEIGEGSCRNVGSFIKDG